MKLTTGQVLNCEGLSEPACKDEFGRLFDEAVVLTYLDDVRNLSANVVDAWNNILAELPSNDPYVEPIKSAISDEYATMQSLNNSDKLDNITNLLVYIGFGENQNIKKVKADEATKLRFKELKRKYFTDFYSEDNRDHAKSIPVIIKSFFRLYKGLRNDDLETYPKYRDLKEKFFNLEKHTLVEHVDLFIWVWITMKNAIDFFHLKNTRKLFRLGF